MVSEARSVAGLGPVYAFTALSFSAYSVLFVSLPFRFEELGLGVVQYSAVVAAVALGFLLTETAWGALAYRLASRGLVVGLGSLAALSLLAVGVSNSAATFALSCCSFGAIVIFPVPLVRWLALTAGGPGTGGRGTARLSVFFGAGTIAGSALGPLLFVDIGFFWLSVAATALWVLAIGSLAMLPWARLELPLQQSSFLRQVRQIFTPRFAAACAFVAMAFVCYSLTSNFLQYYSVGTFHGSPAESGYTIGAMRATALAAGFSVGRLVDRWGPARSSSLGFLLIAAGCIGTLFAGSYGEMLAATLVFGAGVGWLGVSLLPLALIRVAPALQGTAVGVFGSFEDVGQLIGPVLIGGAYSVFGEASIFVVVAGVASAGAAGSAVLALTSREDRPPS